MYVDAMAMDLVRRPERYQVLVASNLFGDIISDLAAEITGGIGMAPSANIHPGRNALFEPVHGSAPDIAGQGKANPIGAIRCVALMMDHFGLQEAGERIEAAAVASFEAGTRHRILVAPCRRQRRTWILQQLSGLPLVPDSNRGD